MASDKPEKDLNWLRFEEEPTCEDLNGVNTETSTTASSHDDWHRLRGVKFTGKEIGCGTYGNVYEVEYKGRLYAAKESHLLSISPSQYDEKLPQDSILSKFQIWHTLGHPCITQFIGLHYPAEVDKLPIVIMERMYSNLRGLLERDTDIPVNITLSILSDVCLGLQYLHTRDPPIAHGNLTPNNILLCYYFKAKLSDVGVVDRSQKADAQMLSQQPGMNGFLPSESLTDKPTNDLPLDILSFGRIILYITTRQWPQPALDDSYTNKTEYHQYLDKMNENYANLKPLVLSCLDANPQCRPSVTQALVEIKKAKNSHNQKLCFAIWGAEDLQSLQQYHQAHEQECQQQRQQTSHQPETQKAERLEQQVEEEEKIHQQQAQSQQTVPTSTSKVEPDRANETVEDNNINTPTSSNSIPNDESKSSDVESAEESGGEIIYPLYIARYDYTSRSEREMSFKRGDLFFITNNENNDWWHAKAKHSGEEGCVPNNYITEAPLGAEDWFFGDISRTDAEELLMQPSVSQGSFLVCNNEKRPGEYLLSLRYLDKVQHCELHRVGGSFYLSQRNKFQSISKLIVYYNKEYLPTANNQTVRLKNVCPHTLKASPSSKEGDRWETKRESVNLVKKIDTGKYCELWEGVWNNTSVAVKTTKPDSTEAERLITEMKILKQLSHPNMIGLHAVCSEEEPIYIITELTKYGNLLWYLRGEGRSMELPQLIDMMAQIAAGMAYLGEHNYVHQDLAARNVMLAEGFVCKLADFTLAQAITAGIYEPHSGVKLAIKWTAPEVLLYNYYTVKSDVWSFGVLMYELITRGRLPYPGMTNPQVVQAVKTGYRMPAPKVCPEQVYKVMRECWKDDAARRPTFEVLQGRLKQLSTDEHLELPPDELSASDSDGKDVEEEEDNDQDDEGNQIDQDRMFTDDPTKKSSYINLPSATDETDPPSSPEKTAVHADDDDNGNDDYEMVSDDLFRSSECPVYVAKYDYMQRTDKDLSFKKGDLLYILDREDQDWWLAKNSFDKKGFIPSNHVVDHCSLEAHKWYFGEIDRKAAEDLLMHEANTSGSFLIRNSESTSSGYSLSVRNAETVIHYKINRSEEERFHIVPCIVFESIVNLVTYYGKQSDGLCANLMYPCSTGEKPQTIVGESEKPEDLEVSKESVRLIRKLGVGRFGEIWQGMWNNTTPVAVKMLNVGSTGLHDFLKAAVLLRQLTHPKLIQVYAISSKEVPIYIIMELMKYGTLLDYLKSEHSSLNFPQLIDMGVQVAAGMAYLEEKKCIHRDLAAKNIYVTINHICKLAGLSVMRVSENAIGSQNRGMSPVKWTAPEALLHASFTIKSDVWSFGILLYELITYGETPYPDMNNAQVVEALQTSYRMPCPPDCPDGLFEIMTECWGSDPDSRPTFESILYQLENFFTDPKNRHLCPDQDWQKLKAEQEIQQSQNKQKFDAQEQRDQQEVNEQEVNEQEVQPQQQDEQVLQEDGQQLGGQDQPPEEVVINILPSPAMSSSDTPTPPPQLPKALSIISFKSLKDEKEVQDKNVMSRTQTYPKIAAEDTTGEISVSNNTVNQEPSDASSHPLFVGKFNYLSRTNDDLDVRKGDLLYILNTDDEHWWRAKNTSGQEGYIPSNHVAAYGSLNAEEWYFGAITRNQADKLLMHTINENGSFLVRDSERASGGYSLSVKSSEDVIHYKIQKAEGVGYFVGQKSSFQTLFDLIAHYKKQQDGLCASLLHFCFAEKPQTVGLSREANKDWDINRNSIRLMKKLGAGQFGEVWHGMWNNMLEVAVKALKPGIMGVTELLEKAASLRKLRHPKLVQVYAVCTKDKLMYFITEFMKHGSLLDHLKSTSRSLELRHLIDLGSQVAAGMVYLEENNHIHRNLAARNVMMSGRLTCKVADYGLTCNDDTCEDNSGTKFMVKWMAPEAALYSKFSIKSDVWSFGILLYELISYGRFPYPGMNNAQVLEALQTGYRMPCPSCCPEHLYNIMLDCWKSEATARPNFITLKCKMEDFFTETVHTSLYPNQLTTQ